ncbi:MAG: crotonase/enoyl-CoA hydratase family protein [Pseudomonadota bacterium]
MYDNLEVTRDGRGVVTVTLNRPDTRNALNARMISELTDVAAGLSQDAEARVVILRGAGKVFCAGADLTWMQTQIDADRVGRMAEARKLAHMLRALNEMPKPLIGLIHGGAYGGGVGLASVCDVALATRETRFALTETKLGLIPATIAPYVLARMGEGAARRVFFSGRSFDAEEAIHLNLVAQVIELEQVESALETEVAPYLSTAPGALGRAKALVRKLGPTIDDTVIEATIEDLADTWDTEEAAHGIASFLGKTKPRWQS